MNNNIESQNYSSRNILFNEKFRKLKWELSLAKEPWLPEHLRA